MNDVTDEDLLRFYELYWHDHKRISKFVCSVYHYLNRMIQRLCHLREGDIYEINVVCYT